MMTNQLLRATSALAFVAALFLPNLQAETSEEQAVLAPLQGVFEGIAKHDKAIVRQQLLPGGMATLIRNGQIVQLHFDAFVDRLPAGTQKLEERIHDPLIRIDNDIAVIWAPYEFLLEGKLDHCGTDLVNLVHRDGRWLISAIGDNSRSCKP
jgi:Putative lumazine-binding